MHAQHTDSEGPSSAVLHFTQSSSLASSIFLLTQLLPCTATNEPPSRSPPICLPCVCAWLGLQMVGTDLQCSASICGTFMSSVLGPSIRPRRMFPSSNMRTACGQQEFCIYSNLGTSKARQGHIYLLSHKMPLWTFGDLFPSYPLIYGL